MKKIAFILSCIMIMALIPALAVSADEIPTTPIPVSTVAEFEAMSDVPGHYYLTNDIDFMGKVYDRNILDHLDGSLDGAGFKIYNFSINYTEAAADAGLILRLGMTHDTTVSNLNIGSKDIPIVYTFVNNNKSVSPFAAVIGNNDPGTNVTVENVHIYADVDVIYADPSHKGNAAGFCAYACKKGSAAFKNCSFNGSFDAGVENEGSVYRNAAAFISANNLPQVDFTDCVNNANVTQGATASEARSSGFVAYSADGKNMNFTNCTNNGNITTMGADSDAQVSGFVSDARGVFIFTNCVNNGEIKGSWYSGGFIALLQKEGCKMIDCANNGKIGEDAVLFSATGGMVPPGCEIELVNFKNTSNAPAGNETTEEETTEAPAPDTTPAPAEEDTTEAPAPADTTEAPAPADTTAAPAPDTTEPAKSGCGGMISGVVAVVAILGTALIIKKRD